MTKLPFLALAVMLALAACQPAPQATLGPDGKPIPVAYRITPKEEAQIPVRLLGQVNILLFALIFLDLVRRTDGTVTVGITAHAQEALGDIVFFEVQELGKTVDAGDTVAVIERATSWAVSPRSVRISPRDEWATNRCGTPRTWTDTWTSASASSALTASMVSASCTALANCAPRLRKKVTSSLA